MTESPPRTPLSLRRLAPPTTPIHAQFSDDGNDENEQNFVNTPKNNNKLDQSISCQSDIVFANDYPSIEHSHSVGESFDDGASEVSVSRLKGWLDDFGKQNHDHYAKNNRAAVGDSASSQSSDCESDLSVTRLKGWLDDFGKQNRAHYDKVNHVGKAPDGVTLKKTVRAKSANTPASKPMVAAKPAIRRTTDPSVMSAEMKKGPAKTPVRYKSRFKKDEVQATNDGYASVKKIAAWLAEDPTTEKKTTTVRKGINVINKSRLFEKDLEHVIIEQNRIVKGSVSQKKGFFQSEAFAEDDGNCETSSCVSVTDKKKWLECAFGGKKSVEEADIDNENSIASMSVLDKREWLSNAFKGADGGRTKTTTTPSRFRGAASEPGGATMVPRRNEEAVMSVKEKFQSRAASRRTLSDTSDPWESKSSHTEEEAVATKQKWQQRAARRSLSGSTHPPPNCSTQSDERLSSPVKACLRKPVKPSPSSADGNNSLGTRDDPFNPPTIERVKTISSFESPPRNQVARKWQERKAAIQKASPQRPVPSGSPARTNIAKKWQERKVAKERASPQKPANDSNVKETDTVSPSPINPGTRIVKTWQERQSVHSKTMTTTLKGVAVSEDAKALLTAEHSQSESKPDDQSESKPDEEETFDFRAAREKLLKRSAQNGNPLKVINKVTLRKQKYEKLQAEMKRQTAPMGLLKPTWEQVPPDVGPTTSYTKNFVDNIAPKKSFEDLP